MLGRGPTVRIFRIPDLSIFRRSGFPNLSEILVPILVPILLIIIPHDLQETVHIPG